MACRINGASRELEIAIRTEKEELRKHFLSIRKNLLHSDIDCKSKQIETHLLSLVAVQQSQVVMLYYSIGSEVRTDRLVTNLLSSGKRVVIPFCLRNAEMGIAEIFDPRKDLIRGQLGMLEPRFELHGNIAISEIDLIICPGVSFDSEGNRLGRGKAYYDSFLCGLKGVKPMVGLAFQCQISPKRLPADVHDIPMSQIITENGLLLNSDLHLSLSDSKLV